MAGLPRNLGFDHDLFLMPFDHRGSFLNQMFGIKGRAPTAEEARQISSYKMVILKGYEMAVAAGVPKDKSGILTDEVFGSEVLQEALARGYQTACCVEKSGQDEFDFEFGEEFGPHIAKFSPTFVKSLVRYNPEGDAALNRRQLDRLKRLSDYCHEHRHKFMFELLVVATPAQLAKLAGDKARYERELRPRLMIQAMKDIVAAGIEPDLWKLEGIETAADATQIARQARDGGRDHVGVIILGRGESEAKVRQWMTIAARCPGFIGFAIGRTVFWDALKALHEGKIDRAHASEQIARNYQAYCDLWVKTRKA